MASETSWFYWALWSAVFAALTAIFAKIGLEGVDSDLATLVRTLVILVVLAAFVYGAGKWSNPLTLAPKTSAASVQPVVFTPNGRSVAVLTTANRVAVFDAATGALLADLPVGMMAEQVVAWHPDGERLAVGGSDPRIQIWNVAAKRIVATLEGHAQRITTVTFHPDGELLASHGWDGQLLVWHPSSGRQLMRLTSASAPHFSADGRWLGVTWDGDRADLLAVTPTREYRTLVSSVGAGRGGYGYYGDISPDGRLLVVGMDEGARLWDLRSGRELATLPAGTPFGYFTGRGGVRCVVNLGRRPVPLPKGYRDPLLSSNGRLTDATLPPDTAAWF